MDCGLDRRRLQADNAPGLVFPPACRVRLGRPLLLANTERRPMKSLCLACLLTILFSTVVLAQSNTLPLNPSPVPNDVSQPSSREDCREVRQIAPELRGEPGPDRWEGQVSLTRQRRITL